MQFLKINIAFLSLLLSCAVHALAENRSATIVWQTPLPEVGQSDVLVHGNHVYLMSFEPLPEEVVVQRGRKAKPLKAPKLGTVGQCFDKTTGKLLWEVPLPSKREGGVLGQWRDPSSFCPVANDRIVVFYNNSAGCLVGCDHDGKEVWRRTFNTPKSHVKNGRLYLHEHRLIVGLPVDGDWSEKRPFYRLHAIDVETGKNIWVAEMKQSLATHYRLGRWGKQDVMVSNIQPLSHWQFGVPNEVFMISLEDGSKLKGIKASTSAHQISPLIDDQVLCITGATIQDVPRRIVEYRNWESGEVSRTVPFPLTEDCKYFQWSPDGYSLVPYAGRLVGKGKPYKTHTVKPMPGSIHAFENRLYFLTYNGNGLGCLDLKTGECMVIDLPLQMTAAGPIFEPEKVNLYGGLFNSKGKYIRGEGGGRSYSYTKLSSGGFGHSVPPSPVRYKDSLYWQGALGLIYRIDISGSFSHEKVSWISFDPGDQKLHWCAGAVAVDDSGIYARSQRTLFRLTHPARSK